MKGVALVWFALAGLALSWVSIPLVIQRLQPRSRRQLHHTHHVPISRLGGFSILIPFVVAAAFVFAFYPVPADRTRDRWLIFVSSVAMFLLGFVDDVRPLKGREKLLGQLVIATIVYLGGIHIGSIRDPFSEVDYALGAWSYLATVAWLVAFTNLINLIDGFDGLAAGISLMVMALLLYLGAQSDLIFATAVAAVICGALVGFLRFNFPPAKIYLGDGGAYLLGFLIGILALVHSHKGTAVAALVAPLFALALPIVDMALAIARRGIRGIPLFRPDKQHLHHRLVKAGISRKGIVLGFYSCSLVFLVLAFGVILSQGRWAPLLFVLGCLVLLALAQRFSFSREWFAVRKLISRVLEERKHARYALALSRWLQLEAERAASPEELWEDLAFVTAKLGFASLSVASPGGKTRWRPPGLHGPRRDSPCHRYPLPAGAILEFAAPPGMNARIFELLAELAAEQCIEAIERWQVVHRTRFTLPRKEPPGARNARNAIERHSNLAADGPRLE